MDIGLGQQSTLNEFGVLGPVSDSTAPLSVIMNNEFGPIHPGLNQLSTGIDGKRVSTPIYVAPRPSSQ